MITAEVVFSKFPSLGTAARTWIFFNPNRPALSFRAERLPAKGESKHVRGKKELVVRCIQKFVGKGTYCKSKEACTGVHNKGF